MQGLPTPALHIIFSYLSAYDIIALRCTSKFLSLSLLDHPLVIEIHKIWTDTKYHFTLRKKLQRWGRLCFHYPFNYPRIILWYLGGFIIAPFIHMAFMHFFLPIAFLSCSQKLLFLHSSIMAKSYTANPLSFRRLNNRTFKTQHRHYTELAEVACGFNTPNLCLKYYYYFIWLILGGILLAAFHLILAIIQLATIIGVPNAFVHFQYVGFYLFPFGNEIRCKPPVVLSDPRPFYVFQAIQHYIASGYDLCKKKNDPLYDDIEVKISG